MRSGFAAIVGRPNVGKSTLLNALVGQKVAITTPVPQTTRHALRGVLHRPESAGSEAAQVVFVDTPGLHKPKTPLGRRLNEIARGSLADVDCIVFVVDGARGVGSGDAFIAGLLRPLETPAVVALNKIDRFARTEQLPQLDALSRLGDFDAYVPVSAADGTGLDVLVEELLARMPEGPAYFPDGQVTDQPVERIVGEIVREKAITLMREEVPHSIAVVVDEIGPGESEGVTAVHATLYVERASQKGIVIGRGGSVLRDVGARARPEIELALGSRVWLDLRVKLAKEWQRDPKLMDRLGY